MINYDNTSEGFKSHDPYELMIIPPNKKAEMIMKEIKKSKPNLNLVSDLIVLGANLEWEDEDNEGFAPLHLAVLKGQVEIVRMLIGANANLNVQDNDGWTPLHLAARRGSIGNVEVTRILIDAGARKDIPNYEGKLPYDLADTYELKNLLKS